MKKNLKDNEKNNGNRVTLFAAIDKEQYEAIRFIAYKENKSLAEITREALDTYIKNKSKSYPIAVTISKRTIKKKTSARQADVSLIEL